MAQYQVRQWYPARCRPARSSSDHLAWGPDAEDFAFAFDAEDCLARALSCGLTLARAVRRLSVKMLLISSIKELRVELRVMPLRTTMPLKAKILRATSLPRAKPAYVAASMKEPWMLRVSVSSARWTTRMWAVDANSAWFPVPKITCWRACPASGRKLRETISSRHVSVSFSSA